MFPLNNKSISATGRRTRGQVTQVGFLFTNAYDLFTRQTPLELEPEIVQKTFHRWVVVQVV